MTSSNSDHNQRHQELTPELVTASLATVRNVFRGFRSIILERAGNTEYLTKQADGSPVTESDMEIEVALQAELKRLYPDTAVFGEETGYGNSRNSDMPDVYWLIDPIDGTKAFIKGVPTFTCMAVLIQHGEAVASEIYNPTLDIDYSAQKNKGAYKTSYSNGMEETVRIDLTQVPLPPVAHCKERFAASLSRILSAQAVVCRSGPTGGGFGFTTVLDGSVAARFNLHPGGATHDYAPGALLVHEAGGTLWPIRDNPNTSFEARSFIAAHPKLVFTDDDLEKIRSWEKPLQDIA